MDDKNVPTAIIEIVGPKGSLGTWAASGWSGDATWRRLVRLSFEQQAGREMATKIGTQFTAPQTVEVDGKSTHSACARYALISHSVHAAQDDARSITPARDIPKNFQSRVRIENPAPKESREVDIYMNNPLRYSGLTFYQYQMGRG